MNKELMQIDFHNDRVFLVEKDGEPYVPVKPVTDNLGLAWKPQYMKLMTNQKRWGVTIMVIPSHGGPQNMVCMPLKKYPAFINSIEPRKCKRHIRPKLEAYQNESDDALWDYWKKGRAVNPRLVRGDANDDLERFRYPKEINIEEAREWRDDAIYLAFVRLFAGSKTVRRTQFLRAMGFHKIGATRQEAAAMLGISVRQFTRYRKAVQDIINKYKMSATEQFFLHDCVIPLNRFNTDVRVPAISDGKAVN